jgi:pimeloyl-ACP methyl ester carboxylesterase
MAFIQTGRGKFFYLEYRSSGPVVYLLHGLTAKAQDWGSIPDMLAKTGFHVFVFDMRGHGQSDKPENGYSPEDHAADVEAWAGALGHARLHVVGHSTGGRNALVFTALFPQRVINLTIVDQTLTADLESWKKYLTRYTEYPTPFADEAALDKFLKKKFSDDEERFTYYKGQFWKKEGGEWDWNFSPQAAWKTQKLGREKEAYDWLAKVTCPILFIKGGDSRYVSPPEAEKIKGLMPHGRLVVVEKAEHAVFRDNSEGFLKALVPFLKDGSSQAF